MNTNMRRNRIRLSEGQLRKVIKESVYGILNEIGDTYKGQELLGRLYQRKQDELMDLVGSDDRDTINKKMKERDNIANYALRRSRESDSDDYRMQPSQSNYSTEDYGEKSDSANFGNPYKSHHNGNSYAFIGGMDKAIENGETCPRTNLYNDLSYSQEHGNIPYFYNDRDREDWG